MESRQSMKKIVSILLTAIVCVFFDTTNMQAQIALTQVNPSPTQDNPVPTSPAQVPIMSIRTLKAYALSLVSSINGGIWGNSVTIDHRSFPIAYPHKDADVDHMASVAHSGVVRFSADPTEELQSELSYYATTTVPNWSFQIFWGYTKFHLAQVGDNWQVPQEAYKIDMHMSDWIPFKVPGIRNAYIITEDEFGNDKDYYSFRWDNRLNLDEELLFIGSKHVSQKGKLYIEISDGSKIIYNLKDEGSRQEQVSPAVDGFQPSIVGVRSLPVNTISITLQEGDELVRVAYTTGFRVNVTFPQGLSRYPISVHVIDANQFANNPFLDWAEFNPFQPMTFNVAHGAILIRYEYEDQPQPLNDSNSGGSSGGKG